jgi:hypothetical protein
MVVCILLFPQCAGEHPGAYKADKA